MAHRPVTSSLAAVTQALPGPTILSTAGMVSVPYAKAATAWAPPMAYSSSTSSRAAAASIVGSISPSAPQGEATAISPTPATKAGTTVITRVDG